jgi:hypothetical protein
MHRCMQKVSKMSLYQHVMLSLKVLWFHDLRAHGGTWCILIFITIDAYLSYPACPSGASRRYGCTTTPST